MFGLRLSQGYYCTIFYLYFPLLYNDRVVIIAIQRAKNIKEKVIGLIGKEEPIGLMIETRFGIHTFGLKFPIDVLILNKDNKIAVIKKNLKPNRIFVWNPIYDRVLELPEGTIGKKKIKVNEVVELKF